MNFKILPLLAAGTILLSGCNRGSDVSESVPDTSESAEIRSDGAETADDPAFPDSPAGITAPDAPAADDNSGVSLTRDKYDYLREMTDFSGQYMTLEEMGYHCVYIPEDAISGFGYFYTADDEWLYFQKTTYDNDGLQITDLIITEYNILTGEYDSFELPTSPRDLEYIDRDYIVYGYDDALVLLTRENGETITLPESEKYFPNNYDSSVKRIGQGFYYNITEVFSNYDGSMCFDVEVLCKYLPKIDSFAKLGADMDIIGATSEEVFCKSSGGLVYRYGGWVDGKFEMPYDYLHIAGRYMGYISPATTDTIFGRRYEVGRVLPDNNTSGASQKPIFMTHYGTYAADIGITSESVAFIQLLNEEMATVLAVDINGKKAADTGYNEILSCGKDWVYLKKFDDESIMAVYPRETWIMTITFKDDGSRKISLD